MKLPFIAIYLFFAILLSACATTPEERGDVQYEFGIVEYGEVDTIDEPDHIAGKHSFANAKRIKTTSRIKVMQGRAFGVQFVLPTFYEGQEVLVKQVIEFPDSGLTNPTTKETSKTVEIENLVYYSDEPYLLAYILDQPWEMKKGKWKFSISLNQTKYIDHEFILY